MRLSELQTKKIINVTNGRILGMILIAVGIWVGFI